MTTADKGVMIERKPSARTKALAVTDPAPATGLRAAPDDSLQPETRKSDRRHHTELRETERRRSARRYSDRIAASFTSAFVAQWLGQELLGDEPGDELALRRSASLVYAAVQERAAQYYRSLGRHAKKAQDYS